MGDAEAVVKFWSDAGPKLWFSKNADFDRRMQKQFGSLHERAARGELDDWANQANSALALILLLDQFSRNLYRNDARAFAQDEAALKITRQALERGFEKQVDGPLQPFFLMPFMHSESLADQNECVSRFETVGNEDNLKFAIVHRDIIARFGKFPHRDKVLGRSTSAEEQAFLDGGGFSG